MRIKEKLETVIISIQYLQRLFSPCFSSLTTPGVIYFVTPQSSPNKAPSHPFSQTPVPFTKPLHVVFIRGRGAVAVVLGGSAGAARFGPAEAAEQTSRQEEQQARRPTDEDARSQLLLLGRRQHGVVEVSHNVVGEPADGDDHQEAGQQQAHPGRQADLGLDVLVLHAGGEVGPAEQDEEAEAAQHAADDGHGAGGLQIRGQHQHGVVALALLLAGTLHHTARPQAVVISLLTHRQKVGGRLGHLYHVTLCHICIIHVQWWNVTQYM